MDCQVFQKGTKNSQALHFPEQSWGPATLITHWSSEPHRIWATRGLMRFSAGSQVRGWLCSVAWLTTDTPYPVHQSKEKHCNVKKITNEQTNKACVFIQGREAWTQGYWAGMKSAGLPRAPLPTQCSKVTWHRNRKWQASWGPFLCFPSMTWGCSTGPRDRSPSFRDTHPYRWSLPHTSWLSALPPSEPHPQAYLSLPLWQTSRLHRPSPRSRHLPGGREGTALKRCRGATCDDSQSVSHSVVSDSLWPRGL